MLQVILDINGNFFIFLTTFAEAHISLFRESFCKKYICWKSFANNCREKMYIFAKIIF
jgi:hypothetical protein